jgi:hypothetical protein
MATNGRIIKASDAKEMSVRKQEEEPPPVAVSALPPPPCPSPTPANPPLPPPVNPLLPLPVPTSVVPVEVPATVPAPQLPAPEPVSTAHVLCISLKNWNPADWYYVGDLHGDRRAMQKIFDAIFSSNPNANLVFLGDLVDRGPDSAGCYRLMQEQMQKYLGRIHWIAGNHDEGVAWDEGQKKFVSSVEPSEFVGWLNEVEPSNGAASRQELGHQFIRAVQALPRAILMPDGLLAVHGGVPLRDRWEALRKAEDFEEAMIQQDFVWTRAADKPKVRPNRLSKGCSYGYKDFADFCAVVASFFPAQRLVCGHEHIENGHRAIRPKDGEFDVIQILNGFGFNELGQWTYDGPDNYREKLVYARHRFNQLPELHFI